MDLREKKLGSAEVFKGHLLDVFVDDVMCPNGEKAKRELLRHCKASVILPVLDNNKVIIEKQFRYPVNEVIYEFPAGKCDLNEDPKVTAARELEEETGYRSENIEYLGKIYPAVGYSDEVIYIYVARDLIKSHQHLDPNEFVELIEMDLSEVKKLFIEGKILDGKTIATLALYESKVLHK